ncbi:hypothetical protein J5N97_027187 [Dioscorea zingiberensis]|uniref:Receptor-like serine/threonine-protein kinase n=1 Tax=Dioscorea zingiberensis TaxID=325984 RepID=A0A9D5H7D9_9LILI|nr:hypothetical protein J5N97_027187 [Dioscorea zingiberensis]
METSNGTVLWQSFEHPSDTFLPGMRLTLDKKTGKNQLFTSWKSPSDPSEGNYSLGMDPSGSGQIFIWEGGLLKWRSGQWDGKTFIGTVMRSLNLYGFSLTDDVNIGMMYFTFTPANSSLLRFNLQYDGVENTSMLVPETKAWKSVWVQPVNECEIYGHCGINGICSMVGDSPTCSCLQGFEPKSGEEWSNGNWSSGCKRTTPFSCEMMNRTSSSNSSSGSQGKKDGFVRMGGLKLPDFSEWASVVRDPSGCESYCMSNCSCKAYVYNANLGCLVWSRELIDIYQFPSTGNGNDLFIKLADLDLGGSSNTWITIVIVSVIGLASLILVIYLWWKFNAKIKECWKKEVKQWDLFSSLQFSPEGRSEISGVVEQEGEEGKGVQLPLYTVEFIANVTDNFDESNKLGEGGFGIVYKGVLPGDELVAIKRLSRSSGQGLEQFKNEVLLIAKLQHRNLVRLLGCCIEGEEKMLIYEYMPNKSLDAFLFDPSKQAVLDWSKRFEIIKGIARGLLYLHRDSRLRIVHRDLKASNILLDQEMNPKISDFGMAKIFGGDQNEANTNRLVGTYGYMSPEYAMEGLFSVKSDVYSFGVLILEIVTGRRNNSFYHLENSPNIIGYVWPLWNEGRVMELIDQNIQSTCSAHQVLRCIHIGLLCVQDRVSERPDMSAVVLMLESGSAILQTPKQPTFVTERGPTETGAFSVNDLTVSIMSAR